MQQCNDFGKYLGLHANFGASKKVVFDEMRRKIRVKLNGWSKQFLSQVGKNIMIKEVAMAMPNFDMSCFKLPVSLCKEIELDIAKYWWKSNKD